MSNYAYVAIDPRGGETRGTIDVADQSEALRRIKEMGLFPTKVFGADERSAAQPRTPWKRRAKPLEFELRVPWFSGRVKSKHLTIFTRQLATLVEAGMPLLRGLRILQEQEENRTLRRVVGELAAGVESGDSFAEAVSLHPRIFNRLYVNMVKAGEIGGALEITLRRLAEFMEKTRKLRSRVIAAMFYPTMVLLVASGVVTLLMTFVVPRFAAVFEGLSGGRPLPAFTRFVFRLSGAFAHHFLPIAAGVGVVGVLLALALRTAWGRWAFDRSKLSLPVVGPLFRKTAISRFARTLGTLVTNGVPILQALTIVKETAGNVLVRNLIAQVHENVKQGEALAPTLKTSSIFPAMVAGMVDVGEQTGALPEMLMKVADNYDDEVDTAASAMTSVLEPILIVFLAVIVGSIVIAMFLPLLTVIDPPGGPMGNRPEE